MYLNAIVLTLAHAAIAARPFLNEPDTGIEDVFGHLSMETLPNVTDVVGLPDFDWLARKYLPLRNYTYYRNGAAGEWSYRNNLEVFRRFRLRPRVMVDISNIESTLATTILGHNFSSPFYISPCSRGELGHPDAELNFVRAAAAQGILYIPAHFASKTIEEIAREKSTSQILFQQLYLSSNDTEIRGLFKRTEDAGAKAIVFPVDSAADGNRHRAARFGVGSADPDYSSFTWDFYQKIRNMTTLPIILKGIMTVEDARLAVDNGAPAIVLSNHGGRQLDGAPSALEVALEIHERDPEIFKQTEVFADGGIRYGADVLMLLSLGVKAVGLGRPFMYANVLGQPGVERAISILKREIAIDAGNLGVADLKAIDPSFVNWTPTPWTK